MNYEHVDQARVDEAFRVIKDDAKKNLSLEVARLAREGWTPPVAVDPDLAEAQEVWKTWCYNDDNTAIDLALMALKRGRELERAEAKPGMVWEKWDGGTMPTDRNEQVAVIYDTGQLVAGNAHERDWSTVTDYAIITQPEEK